MVKKILNFTFLLFLLCCFPIASMQDYSFSPVTILVSKDCYIAAQIRDFIILRHRAVYDNEEVLAESLDEQIRTELDSFEAHVRKVEDYILFRTSELNQMVEALGYVNIHGHTVPAEKKDSKKYMALKTSLEDAEEIVLTVTLPTVADLQEGINAAMANFGAKERTAFIAFCKKAIMLYEDYIELRRDELQDKRHEYDVRRELFRVTAQLGEKLVVNGEPLSAHEVLYQIGYFEAFKALNSDIENADNSRYTYRILGFCELEGAIQYLVNEHLLMSSSHEPTYLSDDPYLAEDGVLQSIIYSGLKVYGAVSIDTGIKK